MTLTPRVVGPVPPYYNVAIESQFYQPSRFVISAITLGGTTTITTTADHNFVVGNLVRTLVPASFGTWQLNEQSGYVLSIPASNQVVLSINSSNFDSYIASSAATVAQIFAIGDINTGVINSNGQSSTGTSIPGSFINISPE